MLLHRIWRRRPARGRIVRAAVEALEGRLMLSYTLNTLASFNGTDGSGPQAGLVMDSSGNLYGEASYSGPNDTGSIFELAKGSNSITVLAAFDAEPENVNTPAQPRWVIW